MMAELDKVELLDKVQAALHCCDWFGPSDKVSVLKTYLQAAEQQLLDSMPKKCCCECCCRKNRS